jgi:uncharacterized membrane protein YbhN (UPF0104 family)
MDQKDPAPQGKNKRWQLWVKLTVTAVCLWYVSGKIDFSRAGEALATAKWIFLAPAFLLFIFSKWIAAIRLNIYFSNIGIQLPQSQHTRLYWLGMFYNLFLPGSISGDAYKVILLTKKYGVPYRKTTAAVLLDRLSGLLGLGLLLAGYGFIVLTEAWFATGLAAAAIIAVIVLYVVTIKFFPDFKSSFWSTLLLGIAVQAVQVGCIYCIMAGLGIPASQSLYLFVFLVSSVVAVLPLTIGGLGIRELVFLEASARSGLVQESAVLISLLFYLVTLLASLWGMVYVFRDPLKVKDPLLSP